jgi:SH3-like domain-containing protein
MKVLFVSIFTAIITIFVLSGNASALCVDNEYANLRNGPGTEFSKTWEVYKYMPFEKVEKKGSWYKVKDVDGDTHWIYAKLVTEKYKCAVVNNEKANVRTGPGTHFKQTEFSPVLRYYSFKVLKVEGDWVKLVDQDGDEGWIYKPLLWIQ